MSRPTAGLFDLRGQIGFYAQYHHNTWNKLIHIVCVPLLLWTPMIWLARTGAIAALPAGVQSFAAGFGLNPVFDGAMVLALFYGTYYAILEPVAGTVAAGILLAGAYSATYVSFNVDNVINLSIGLHVVCWIAQFIGHGVAEKRAPALFQSLFQSLVLAPLFVWLEVLFAFGYRKSLAKEINIQAIKDIKTFRDSQKNKGK
ncbi:DUF962 domain-containing protein [Capsaspora owczarzaki ATCC 30864]|uniref:DUF962 domain-containing protein n=1 Tax=Capsaspora owczarzaki (strain ATCC 30864) TaxID=595528 RepID=A0A0D2VT60_CAPO3|nr:DUF962 domain-containing protein [Capsaspora owczarzaki ATCC 30864]KJE94412.1 DUF962 domain-containing protein [Capsaspora owczarzaki ATCC 30864]|eukprot:XP_004346740.1 DUF962 domain-containing protein [Capsaspora owczarzaki ATCC 30864]